MELFAEIPFSDIEKIELYQNTKKKYMSQIQAETGADYIINGGIFSFRTLKPFGNIKVNGKILSSPGYGEYGLSWDKDRPVYQKLPASTANYIGCVSMIQSRTKQRMTYNTDMGGVRQRSAIGVKKDRLMIYACNGSNSKSPETLQNYCFNQDWDGALMLDGGGSTQAMFKKQVLASSENNGRGRIVANYILVYLKKKKESCPYKEPTTIIKLNSSGEGAKWVQWFLNKASNANLVVDGAFGPKSVAALRAFQKSKKLMDDGLCGSSTRTELKKYA